MTTINLAPPPLKTTTDQNGLFSYSWARWLSDLYEYVKSKSGKGDKGDPGIPGPKGDPGSIGKHGVDINVIPKAATDTTFDNSILAQLNKKIVFDIEPPLYDDNDAALNAGENIGTVYRKGHWSEIAYLDVVNNDITPIAIQGNISNILESFENNQTTLKNTDIPFQIIYQGKI